MLCTFAHPSKISPLAFVLRTQFCLSRLKDLSENRCRQLMRSLSSAYDGAERPCDKAESPASAELRKACLYSCEHTFATFESIVQSIVVPGCRSFRCSSDAYCCSDIIVRCLGKASEHVSPLRALIELGLPLKLCKRQACFLFTHELQMPKLHVAEHRISIPSSQSK